MGSGLSMASVNKIKELAEQREYSLALDIVDSQDLSKSLNPQFLRVCGEIYMKNHRYVDARRVLLMAHRLAPAGKRVIYSLIDLYLKMGYMDLAKKYYDIYLADADENHEETAQVKYIYAKANGADSDELESYLHPTYVHNLDYDWSFELFMVYQLQGKAEEADILCSDFNATFKNSEYGIIMADIMSGIKDVGPYFDVYPKESVEDNQEAEEQLRQEEAVLLEADYLRINPKEAEITIMVDDFEEVDVGTKRKLKKFLKQQEKAEKASREAEEAEKEDTEDVSSEDAVTENVVSEDEHSDGETNEVAESTEDGSKESSDEGVEDTEALEEENSEDKVSVKGFFKKIFSRKKSQDLEEEVEESEEVSETEENSPEVGAEEAEVDSPEEDTEVVDVDTTEMDTEEDEIDSVDAEADTEEEPFAQDETVDINSQEEQTDSTDIEEDIMKSMTSFDEAVNEDDVELVFEDDGEETMQELHNNKHNSIISVDFEDDDFTAESDTIEGLSDDELANPFDSISAMKKEKEESRFMPKRKTEFVYDDIDLSSDEEEDFEVDDFSTAEDEEFGTMKTHLDEMLDDVTDNTVSYDIHMDDVEEYVEDKEYVIDGIEDEPEEDVVISGIEDIPEEEEKEIFFAEDGIEDVAEETSEEYDVIFENDIAEEVYDESDEVPNESYEESVEEQEDETYEEDIAEEVVEENYGDTTTDEVAEESYEETVTDELAQDVSEEVYDESEEASEEVFEETIEESEEESYEEEVYEETISDETVEESYEETVADEVIEELVEEVYDESEEASEDVYEETVEDAEETYEETEEAYEEATADETEEESSYELDEESSDTFSQAPVETPAPKKSIDFPVFRSSLFPNHNRKIEQVENNFDEIMTKGQDKIQENLLKEEQMQREAEALLASLGIDLSSINVTSSSIDSIGATLYNEPSRDELKASLKIDSVKKSILRKLKEYR